MRGQRDYYHRGSLSSLKTGMRNTWCAFMGEIREDPRLRDRLVPFADRMDAGRKLATYLSGPDPADTCVCAIPAGGVPVGVEIALALRLPFLLAVVRKIRIPGNPEAGFGAVTWDGRIHLNERLMTGLNLTKGEIAGAIAIAQANVRDRLKRFGVNASFPRLTGKSAILVDDGLASGYTMIAAVDAIRACNPASVVVAVPTGSAGAVTRVAEAADVLVCPNIRTGYSFAVADAYTHWHDLSDSEVLAELQRVRDAGLF
jgi:putative phosphoribosyl transferase